VGEEVGAVDQTQCGRFEVSEAEGKTREKDRWAVLSTTTMKTDVDKASGMFYYS
jgi:hypothetical protein